MQQNVEQAHVTADAFKPPVTLLDYYRIVEKKKKTIFIVTVCVAVLAVVYALLLPKIYTAKALLLPVQEEKGLMSALMIGQMGGLAGLAGGALGGPTQADLYVTMLRSEPVKDALIDRFKLMDVYKAKLRSDAYKALDKSSSIISGKKDGVITIAVNDKDPKLAADLANAYMDELGKMAVKLTATGAGKNRVFLEERMAKAKGDLAQAEEALKQFQSKNKTIDVTGQVKASIEGIAKLKAELAAQEVRVATLRMKFTDTNTYVKTAMAAVDNLKAQIARQEGGEGGSSIPSVGTMPSLGQQYIQLMREYKIQESLVELLTKQYEMAQFTESKDVSPFQIIQKARVPDRKSKPNRKLIVLTATINAFVLSVLAVIVLDMRAKYRKKEA